MDTQQEIRRQRSSLLRRLETRLEGPMVVLGVIWLALVILEFTGQTHPGLLLVSRVVWAIFILDFALKLLLAPDKWRFLRRNVLTLFSLLLPALRVLRVFRAMRLLRAARAVRGLRLVRLLTSANRGIRALGSTLHRRGFGYVMLTTLLVLFAGAAGMLAFEGEAQVEGGLRNYGDALWWTAMILVTLGSDYWPRTAEGRVLCLILATYGFSMFGYVTATLAGWFVAADAGRSPSRAAVGGAARPE